MATYVGGSPSSDDDDEIFYDIINEQDIKLQDIELEASGNLILIIRGITAEVSEETLGLLLESKRRCGGGPVHKLDVDIDRGQARVVYQNNEDAENVLKKGKIQFSGLTLTVTKYEPPMLAAKKQDQIPVWDRKTVHVAGVTRTMTTDEIELIYESKRKSGGGGIESIEKMEVDEECAVLITFQNESDAAGVLAKEIVYIEETEQVLYATKHIIQAVDVTNKVMIDGLPPDISADVVELVYESRNTSGGGPTTSIELVEKEAGNDRGAIITFEREQDACSVIKQRLTKWDKNTFTASKYREPPLYSTKQTRAPKHQSTKPTPYTAWGEKPSHPSSVSKQCIQVCGLPPSTSTEYVRLWFESNSNSGGGPIRDLKFHSEISTAIIVFMDDEIIKTIMQRHQSRPLRIDQHELQLQILPTSLFDDNLDVLSSRSILAQGFSQTVSEDTITLLFENKRITGGDKLDKITVVRNEGKAVLTYRTNTVAERVVDTYKCNGIPLDDDQLVISMLSPRCLLLCQSETIEPDMLLIKNIHIESQKGDVEDFFNTLPNCKLNNVIFGIEHNKALVKFATFPGYGPLLKLVCQTALYTNMLELYGVPKSTSLQVFGIEKLSAQKLQIYFEHVQSEGGTVNNIQLLRDHNCAIVEFQDIHVALRVLSHINHRLEGQPLHIPDLYYDCIGIIPPGHDTTSQISTPKDVIIPGISSHILHFIMSNDVIKQDIEEQMLYVHAALKWPAHSSSEADFIDINITCLLQQDMPNIHALSINWKAEVSDVFQNIIISYTRDECNVIKEVWEELIPKVDGLRSVYKNDVVIDSDSQMCTVYVTGKQDVVVKCLTQIKQESKEIIDRLEKRKTRIQETITILKPHELNLLVVTKFKETINQLLPHGDDITMHIDVEGCEIRVCGMPLNVQKLKVELYDFKSKVTSKEFTTSYPAWLLLKEANMQKHINDILLSKHIEIVWEISTQNTVIIHAISIYNIDAGWAVIQEQTGEKCIPLKEGNDQLIGTSEWSNVLETMKDMCEGMIVAVTNDKTIEIAAHINYIDLVEEQLTLFLETNTRLKKFHPMSESKVKYIVEYMPAEIKDSEEIKVTPSFTWIGFEVNGISTQIQKTLNNLKSIEAAIIEKTYTITKPGIPKYFKEERGKLWVDNLQKEHKVIIAIDPPSHSSSAVLSYNKSVIKFDNKVIYVTCGDLTECRVDAIVNAANSSMKHGGGIAKVIVDKGGSVIDQQSSQHVQRYGSVKTGRACVTDAGNLPCKKVIHTVGPIYKGGNNNEANHLYQAVSSALDHCTKEKLTSIGLPAISAGKYGYPLDEACGIITGAIRDFLRTEVTTIAEIHLVDTGPDVVDALDIALKNTYKYDKVTVLSGNEIPDFAHDSNTVHAGEDVDEVGLKADTDFNGASGGDSFGCADDDDLKLMEDDLFHLQEPLAFPNFFSGFFPQKQSGSVPTANYSGYWKSGVTQNQLVTQEDIVVTLEKGNILQQQVDVIVNLTSEELNLMSGGAVSKNILKACGPALQGELKTVAPNGVKRGQVVVTSGGKLNCNNIYHGACANKQHLEDYFKTCLLTAHNNNMRSIAFPSIGTGSMGISADYVANMMYSETKSFSTQNPNTSLTNINFVVFDDKTTKSFEQYVKELTQPGVRPKSKKSSATTQVSSYWQKGGHKAEIISAEGIVVSVEDKPITNIQADVLVNLTSCELELKNGAVSTSILQAAGPGIQVECQQKAPQGITYGGFVCTGGHNLSCQYVYHGACNKHQSANANTNLTKYIDTCLNTAHIDGGVQSIAFPALGTGSLGFPPKEVADLLLDRVKCFSTNNPATALTNVYISVFKSKLKDSFEKAIAKQFKKVKSKEERKLAVSFGAVVKQKFKSLFCKSSPAKSIMLLITGTDEQVIQKVIQSLNTACENEVADKVFDSPSDQEFIQMLTQEQIDKLKGLEKEHDVDIRIERGQRISRIRVQGSHADIAAVTSEVQSMFREAENRNREIKHNELIGKSAQWWYEDEDGERRKYPTNINAVIEKAYLENKPAVEWDEESRQLHSVERTKKVRVTFKEMREFDFQCREYHPVARESSDSDTRLPTIWTAMPQGELYQKFTVDPQSQEYQGIQNSFFTSMQASGLNYNNIISVKRIQNPLLHKQYQIHRNHMNKTNPAGTRNEQNLWHGTSAAVLQEIYANGFNRSMGKQDRKWYGEGVYFATHAGLSAQHYCPQDANGHKYIFRCSVLTGEYTKGHKSMKVPPPKNPNIQNVKCDSVVDDPNSPKEWIIFGDNSTVGVRFMLRLQMAD